MRFLLKGAVLVLLTPVLATMVAHGQVATDSIALTSDGTYQIAASGNLNGLYLIDWLGPYRAEHYLVSVASQQFDIGSVQILNATSYQGSVVLSNFRLVADSGGTSRYLVVDVANRNGGTGDMSVTAIGGQAGLSLSATASGSVAVSDNVVSYIGQSSNSGLGTQTPNNKLEISGGAISFYNPGLWTAVGLDYDPTSDTMRLRSNNGSTNLNQDDLSIQRGSGNVGIGTISPGEKLEVDGNIKLTAGSGSSVKYADGTTQSTAWTGTLTGGDYAESVDITGDRDQYEPGDVLIVDRVHPGHFLKSSERYSLAVAGVYSTKPGVTGRRQKIAQAKATTEIPMAMVGIVPTKVTNENGPIEPGDILVSSSRPGYAMKGTDRSLLAAAVIGKALAPMNEDSGVIEAVISLQ